MDWLRNLFRKKHHTQEEGKIDRVPTPTPTPRPASPKLQPSVPLAPPSSSGTQPGSLESKDGKKPFSLINVPEDARESMSEIKELTDAVLKAAPGMLKRAKEVSAAVRKGALIFAIVFILLAVLRNFEKLGTFLFGLLSWRIVPFVILVVLIGHMYVKEEGVAWEADTSGGSSTGGTSASTSSASSSEEKKTQ